MNSVKMYALIVLWGLCIMMAGCVSTASNVSSEPWSVKMTQTVMKRNADIWSLDFASKPKWSYTYGTVYKAMWQSYLNTKDPAIPAYIERYYDALIQEDGTILTYSMKDYNIDQINPGMTLFDVYHYTGKAKYRQAIQTLRDQMKVHPRTTEGGFWHKQRYPHQMWLDGLYMGSPFLARYAVEYKESQLLDDVANQFVLMEKHARDAKTGLLYHAWDEGRAQRWANPQTGQSPNFWGRGMGWYAMALVDVLDYMPASYPRRPELTAILDRLFTALTKYQDSQTGLWYQVVDQGGRQGNYLEASASSMFVYAMTKAVRVNAVGKKYLAVARKGYQGILTHLITEDSDGLVSIHQCCAVAGLGGTPYRDGSYEYYIGEPVRDNDPKAIGPFILAALEWERLESGKSN
ncbi:glycoside hydrolase family 88/105 protein [Anaerohalosphaeraceae bacterium U12dextr]